MCRLLGYAATTETTFGSEIGPLQCATFQGMSRLHADGWGTAWRTAEGDLLAEKDVHPAAESPRLTTDLAEVPARARIVHLRLATEGMPVSVENAHPFVKNDIAFAHNGSIVPTEWMREKLGPAYLDSDDTRTDSTLYFALVRQEIERGYEPFDAVERVVRGLREEYPIASLNALILTDHELIAVHSSENAKIPHHEFDASGLTAADLPRNHVDAYYKLSYRRTDDAVVFSSTGIDVDGWERMPTASIARVDLETLDIDIRELDGRARAAA